MITRSDVQQMSSLELFELLRERGIIEIPRNREHAEKLIIDFERKKAVRW